MRDCDILVINTATELVLEIKSLKIQLLPLQEQLDEF